jgi:AbrB family looped-hinge helix DNA binding protein
MVTVDTKGRIVLPSKVREQLGLRPGSEVAVTTKSGKAVVKPETDPKRLMDDLETMIDEAAENREHRRKSDPDDAGRVLDEDPIAANHRDVIRQGAARTEMDDADARK